MSVRVFSQQKEHSFGFQSRVFIRQQHCRSEQKVVLSVNRKKIEKIFLKISRWIPLVVKVRLVENRRVHTNITREIKVPKFEKFRAAVIFVWTFRFSTSLTFTIKDVGDKNFKKNLAAVLLHYNFKVAGTWLKYHLFPKFRHKIRCWYSSSVQVFFEISKIGSTWKFSQEFFRAFDTTILFVKEKNRVEGIIFWHRGVVTWVAKGLPLGSFSIWFLIIFDWFGFWFKNSNFQQTFLPEKFRQNQ